MVLYGRQGAREEAFRLFEEAFPGNFTNREAAALLIALASVNPRRPVMCNVSGNRRIRATLTRGEPPAWEVEMTSR